MPGCNAGLCQQTATALQDGVQPVKLLPSSHNPACQITLLSGQLLLYVKFIAASEGSMV